MVLETNMNEIVAQVEAQGKLEKAEVSSDTVALPLAADRPWAVRGWPMGTGVGVGASRVLPVSSCPSPRVGLGTSCPVVLVKAQGALEAVPLSRITTPGH